MEYTLNATKLIGTLAVENGWVSFQQVQLALADQNEGVFFGEILLNKNLINKNQLNELLRLQAESKIKEDDFLFGQIAVQNNFVKAQDVINAIEEQKKTKKYLGLILQEKGLLTAQQCNAIIKSQNRLKKIEESKNKKVACPKCKTFYQIKDAERYRKVRCKNCQFIFEVGRPEVKVETKEVSSDTNISNSKNEKSIQQFLKENNLTIESNIFSNEKERYILGKEIARGGMGSIILTKDVNLRRNIVTKVLLKKHSKQAALRFIEEAQITGQLEHPNIPPVHDLGINKDNNIFFTMKQIKGETLLDIIKKIEKDKSELSKKYTYKNLVSILIKVCNALEYAHSKNVIHRDIKPENIMVGEYGEVLLMDWGLAKIIGSTEVIEELEEEKVSSVRTEDESSNTIAGTTSGTPAYMSPEQALGQLDKLDQRSDIYSLGATLFNVLSLEKPYKGSSVFEILNNAADGNMQELKGNFPPELKAITLKAMAYKQRDRYQTIVEMEEDLLKYQMGYSVSAKKDNAIELLIKFYQRNKALTIVILSFLVLTFSGSIVFILSLQEQRNRATSALAKAELAIQQFEKEKSDRIKDNKNSAPTYYTKAQNEAQLDRFNEAELLMDKAISYDPENQNYILYRGCILIANNKFEKAKTELNKIVNHPQQQKITKLVSYLNTLNIQTINEKDKIIIAEICTELKIMDVSQKLTTNILKKLELWNAQLKAAWPKELFQLYLKDNDIIFKIDSSNENLDLSPLRGIPIHSVQIANCLNLSNISALEFIPVESLTIIRCPLLSDISALKNRKLKYFFLEITKVSDLSPLMNSELNTLILKSNPITTIKPLSKLPIKEIEFFNINLTQKDELKPFALEKLTLNYSNIDNLDLINIKNLKELRIFYRLFSDISPLKDIDLEVLEIANSGVKSFQPIRNKKIKYLNIGSCDLENFQVILTLKNLETLIIQPNSLPEGWEDVLLKMKNQIKNVGIGSGSYLKSVDQFLIEYKGINNKNVKKQ